MPDPVLVEVLRGGVVESVHRAAFAVMDADGRIVQAVGDVEQPVFSRSAAKPLQALPLVASGAADRFGLSSADIAIACGSHLGEPDHVSTVGRLLAKCGQTPAELECGSHWPLSEVAARDLAAAGAVPSALHNNCSGKHAGFLCLARELGVEPAGYVRPEHPVMRLVTGSIEAACGTRLDESCMGIDGCSIPTFALPLRTLATAFARLGTGYGLPSDLAVSAARIRAAVASHPRMIGGTKAFDTRVAEVCGEGALCKSGAEGVAAIAIPAAGLGIAIKVADGSGRAIEPLAAALIARFSLSGPSTVIGTLASWSEIPLHNRNGTVVGSLRAVPGW